MIMMSGALFCLNGVRQLLHQVTVQGQYLVDVVQFGTWPAAIVRFLPKPLGTNFHSAAAGLAAARPVGPFAEFTV